MRKFIPSPVFPLQRRRSGTSSFALCLFISLLTVWEVKADSVIWTFRPFFIKDDWNTPILAYNATIPPGQVVAPENIRALVSSADLAALRTQANGDRVTKRAPINKLQTAEDVTNARQLLIPPDQTMTVAVFQTAASYLDRLGLLGIMQLLAQWQCSANEQCPEKVMKQLDPLLAVGGTFMKTEVFKDISGQPWIISTVTYEVPIGSELRVVPLRSRKLQVQLAN